MRKTLPGGSLAPSERPVIHLPAAARGCLEVDLLRGGPLASTQPPIPPTIWRPIAAIERGFAMPFDLIDKLEELAKDLPDHAQDAIDRVIEILEGR